MKVHQMGIERIWELGFGSKIVQIPTIMGIIVSAKQDTLCCSQGKPGFMVLMKTKRETERSGAGKKYDGHGSCLACNQLRFDLWHFI